MIKKGKKNYRPVSILSNISKLYERCTHQQINGYFESFLSKFQCGFRQGFSAQHCFLVIVEKIKIIRDNKGAFAAVLSDLSKAVDCIPHSLLTAKLNAFGFDKKPPSFTSTSYADDTNPYVCGQNFSEAINDYARNYAEPVPFHKISTPENYVKLREFSR